MTRIYFVRHAQADNTNRDGRNRPLTENGLRDRALVTDYLQDIAVDAVYASPFRRAVDTIAPFAQSCGLAITTVEDFRERKSDSNWLRDTDFEALIERQWADFSYSLSDGECLAEVQERNIRALNEILRAHEGQTLVIGTHGMALSTIIRRFDPGYGYADCMDMLYRLPWIVRMDFDGERFLEMEKIDPKEIS